MIGYVYNLYAKTEDDIFYVGITVNPTRRIKEHRIDYPYTKYDCKIGMSIIEEVEVQNFAELKALETYWIQQFVAWGFSLTNYNLGFGIDVRSLKGYIEIEKAFKNGYVLPKLTHYHNLSLSSLQNA